MKMNDGLRTAAKALGIDLEKESAEFGEVFARYVNTPQWMKAPNGKPTKLTARQWVQVRTPSFKKKAGDWEAVQRREQLENTPRVKIKVGTFVQTEGESVQETAKKLFKKAVQKDTVVGQITIDERSAKDSLEHGYGQKKLDVLVTLQNDFDNAVYLGSAKDFDGNDLTNHYFAYPVNYDGELNYVFCRAREDKHQNRLYVHEVFLASELNEKGDTLQTGSPSNGRPQHGGIALYKNILQEILNANPNGVTKVLDENGEPKFTSLKTPECGISRE